MKKLFVIDWCLVMAFALTAFSGFELHVAGHFSTHEVWHNWAVFHTLSSLAFIITSILHVQTHWGWYKGLITKGLGKKSRVTVVLSLIFLIASVTGIVLLGVQGCCSGIGMWHYKMGILLTLVGVGHLVKRFSILRKSLGS